MKSVFNFPNFSADESIGVASLIFGKAGAASALGSALAGDAPNENGLGDTAGGVVTAAAVGDAAGLAPNENPLGEATGAASALGSPLAGDAPNENGLGDAAGDAAGLAPNENPLGEAAGAASALGSALVGDASNENGLGGAAGDEVGAGAGDVSVPTEASVEVSGTIVKNSSLSSAVLKR